MMASVNFSHGSQPPFPPGSLPGPSSAEIKASSGHMEDLSECQSDSNYPAVTGNSVDYSVDNGINRSITNSNNATTTTNITINGQYVVACPVAETTLLDNPKVPLPEIPGTRVPLPHVDILPSTSTSLACQIGIIRTDILIAFSNATGSINAYISQVGTRKRTKKYRQILRQLGRELEIQRIFFESTSYGVSPGVSGGNSKMVILEGLKSVLGEIASRFQQPINKKVPSSDHPSLHSTLFVCYKFCTSC